MRKDAGFEELGRVLDVVLYCQVSELTHLQFRYRYVMKLLREGVVSRPRSCRND
jgi:hypothetical protein